MRKITYPPKNEMLIHDMRRVLRNFIYCMPKAYRKRTTNATVVMDILQSGTGQAGFTSCVETCRFIGCDPYAHEFPDWGIEDLGGRVEYIEKQEGATGEKA